MLPKRSRLKKEKEIARVFKKGQASYNKIIGIKAIKTDNLKSRLAVIVGLKVSKKAVIRNKIKRRIREILRPIIINLPTSYDLIAIALKGIEKAEFKEIKEAINKNLAQLKIL